MALFFFGLPAFRLHTATQYHKKAIRRVAYYLLLPMVPKRRNSKVESK
jgi:hypothetical protein